MSAMSFAFGHPALYAYGPCMGRMLFRVCLPSLLFRKQNELRGVRMSVRESSMPAVRSRADRHRSKSLECPAALASCRVNRAMHPGRRASARSCAANVRNAQPSPCMASKSHVALGDISLCAVSPPAIQASNWHHRGFTRTSEHHENRRHLPCGSTGGIAH